MVFSRVCRTPTRERRSLALAFEYPLILIATLFISPISWINHYVVLLLPYAAAFQYVRTRPKTPSRSWALYSLVASFLLVSSSASRLMQAFSHPFLGALILGTALAALLPRLQPATQGRHGPPDQLIVI